jgi:hypothetical protein
MKNFKTLIFTFAVLLLFSCSENEEIIEMESKSETEFLKNDLSSKNANGFILYITGKTIKYAIGTDEDTKELIRTYGMQLLGEFSIEQCSVNSNIETWTLFEPISELESEVPGIAAPNFIVNYLNSFFSSDNGITDGGGDDDDPTAAYPNSSLDFQIVTNGNCN